LCITTQPISDASHGLQTPIRLFYKQETEKKVTHKTTYGSTYSTVFKNDIQAARVREEFIQYVLTQAEAAGYYPARWQREIDWKAVWDWATRVRTTDFAWADRDNTEIGAIVVGPAFGGGYAIHSGQHRILGGLAAGKPVPADSMTWVDLADRIKPWNRYEDKKPSGAGFSVDELLLALAL